MVIACVLALISFGLGVSMMVADPHRLAGASFNPIREAAPIHVWGIAFAVAGFAGGASQVVRWFGVVAAAHACCGFMCLFWAGAFVTGLSNPAASVTGIWAYLGLGLAHSVICAVAAMESKWRV